MNVSLIVPPSGGEGSPSRCQKRRGSSADSKPRLFVPSGVLDWSGCVT
jgi:hypothetical protein